ncbi:bifunctional riboflavin kinase/FAD synthetase [Micromonospora sp. NBC_01655]|uniref:riboflavin kinase n=1 Tax=Micromonospora sp. NBC_01655 TaxID=2975983 RepID=UPI00225A3C1A|nr:riboflavin kinase [Micromonospora sp. NBC_01655]MCX4474629.1 bifunctional riboflavin kinase/FAD synthetase [Micromonospora sp. NBC_01655]
MSDGSQLGSDRLVWSAVAEARRLRVACVLLLVVPSPAEAAAVEDDGRLLAGLGVDAICVQPLAVAPAGGGWDEPAVATLVAKLPAVELVLDPVAVAAGGGDLAALGRRTGVAVHAVDSPGQRQPDRLSVAYVRERLLAGDVAAAAETLGCPHRVAGVVVHGEGRGSGLGFPTANLALAEHSVVPGDGIYAGWFTVVDKGWSDGDMVGGICYPAAISIGRNPTFAGRRRTVEPHVLGVSANLYGQTVTTDFVERVRVTERFDSIEELIATMQRDIERVRSVLREAHC